jgi:sugar phosphate isomerase/epimerase
VLVDTLHLARSGGRPADLTAVPALLLPYLQVADAPAAGPGEAAGLLDEALNGRLLPGEGALPIGETLATVPAVPLSFEVRSRALRGGWPDPVERARRVLLAATALVGDGQRLDGGLQAFSS